MNAKGLHLGLIALLVLMAATFLGGAYEANHLLQHTSHTLAELKAESQVATNQQSQLVQAKADIKKYGELNTIAQSVVPQDKDQAEAVREIVDLANESGLPQLSSITFPASQLGVGTSIKTSSGLTQVTPVKGSSGVYDLQITVEESKGVAYDRFITFLKKLEQNRRTAQVSSVTVKPLPDSPNSVSFTLVIDEFIKP
jgi:hypothetical protein